MARALLVALTYAAVASASRYADYSGVKMPQYGADYDINDAPGPLSATEDYQGHAADAPAALDYKYEEESNGKSAPSLKEIADADPWPKPAKKQRLSMRPVDSDNLDNLDKYSSNDNVAPKLKSSHRFSKHRSRIKTRSQSRSDELRRQSRYDLDRFDVSNRNDYIPDKDEFPDDKSKDFDDDVSHYSRRVTERIIRRKARDRFVKSRADSDTPDDVDLQSNKRMMNDPISDLEFLGDIDGKQLKTNDRERIRERMRPTNDDEREMASEPRVNIIPKVKEEYSDYYDMKRVQNLKKKLPELLPPIPTWQTPIDPKLIWKLRRAQGSDDLLNEVLSNITRTTTRETTPSSSTTTTTNTTTTTITTEVQTQQTTTELSLAEKSRLSILKKSQKKDISKKEFSTNKPPVLLLVTKQVPTVVIVEPPSSQNPWKGARLVSDDSPKRLDKVKRLMRKKLVAGARNIQDLTNNWDDMVCDYIDTSLLDNSASTSCITLVLISIMINIQILVF